MSTTYKKILISGTKMEQLALKALGDGATEQAKRAGESYEKQICQVLDKIDLRKTGQAVLRAIQRQVNDGYSMRIEPYLKNSLYETPNADATPQKPWGGQGEKIGREGRRRDTIIRFNPAHWGAVNIDFKALGIPDTRLNHGPGNEPDEMLLHEMVHGLRDMSGVGKGLFSNRAVPGQAQYDTMEEFYAILITNIYRSECGRPGLRWAHSRFFISYDVSDAEFLKTELNRRHLRQLRRQNTMLFNDLNNVIAPFNPTRAFNDG